MSFFVRQPKALEKSPDRTGGNRYAPLREEPRGHLVKRDLASCFHLCPHPIFVWRQFADARITLTFGRKRPGFAFQFDHVIDEFDRYIEPRCRRVMRIASQYMRHNALTKLLWMRFAHIHRLCLFPNKESRFTPNGNPESDHTQSALGFPPFARLFSQTQPPASNSNFFDSATQGEFTEVLAHRFADPETFLASKVQFSFLYAFAH